MLGAGQRRRKPSVRAADADQNRIPGDDGGGSATVEVVAVSSFPAGPKSWWRPDGTPLDEPPADASPYPLPQGAWKKSCRTILVKISDLPRDAYLRWQPTSRQRGSRATVPDKGGQKVPGLEAHVTSIRRDRATCAVKLRLASGPWKTEVTNDGRGGRGTFVNGHKFSFGKARPFTAHGLQMTVFAVAHNFFEQDRRIVAVDHAGKAHPAVRYSAGSDGDKKWVIDIIDAEFDLPPDQIKEYQVQFRPFELAEIKDIALNPRSTGKSNTESRDPHHSDLKGCRALRSVKGPERPPILLVLHELLVSGHRHAVACLVLRMSPMT